MGDLSQHFSTKELACPHCGELQLDPKLVPALEALRSLAGAPIDVHDAYRCAVHNKEVGGVPNSEHMTGKAADVVIEGKSLQEMYNLAVQVPDFLNGGIGVYDGQFIHVDVRDGKARWSRIAGHYGALDALVSE
jgi:uncharacterized protein YcbK (DUF882 family)